MDIDILLHFFMKKPLIITNFKAYPTSLGENASTLARIHNTVAQETRMNFAIAVHITDIQNICYMGLKIPIFSQHCDPAPCGACTGNIPPSLLRNMGVTGTILNHSEKRLPKDLLARTIASAKQEGLLTVVCAESEEEGREITEMSPDFIAIEPPELIGGDISISTADPELIQRSVETIGKQQLLVGAGIKNGTDVKIACELGAVGILLASGVTKAKNPKKVLLDLVSQL